MFSSSLRIHLSLRTAWAIGTSVVLFSCSQGAPLVETGQDPRSLVMTTMAELNDGACRPGQEYVQEPLREPVKIGAHDGEIETELVVRIRERCVPVWVSTPEPHWEMQTLELRTYGFPRDPGVPITEADANDPDSPNVAWSAPGPTFVMNPATEPGAPDGTRFKMRLYNRMPHDDDPHGCVTNIKCNTQGDNAGVDPVTGECREEPQESLRGFGPFTPGQRLNGDVIEPPNCFHGNSSTNFHFHGFHVSSQLGQDFVGLELRPPLPDGVDESAMPAMGSHGETGHVAYGHFDFDVDPLRYTQPPGTHWYHAHKHGSTALQVLNGLVGTFEVRGEFDEQLESYFASDGGGELVDRLMVVQQLLEQLPGLGGDRHRGSVLVNGQANPIVTMAKGEIQRWRFVGATMQASAALRVGFPEVEGKGSPEVRQIAMDGVQFSPDNYECQPFLNEADCELEPDNTGFNELTSFNLSPGNRIDVLVKAPLEAGTHCMVQAMTTELHENAESVMSGARELATMMAGSCGVDPQTRLGPLFTLVVEDRDKPMTFPTRDEFPPNASYLADIPPVEDPANQRDIYYEMVHRGNLETVQFWINQVKYDPGCANQTLRMDVPEHWTLWNNSGRIAHPFHIHQNPFQLLSESGRGTYKYPVWRDTLAIPVAPGGDREPNSNPRDPDNPWGSAELNYVAKEFTGLFVHHCHILGHEDRGMMHNTQSSCANDTWGLTGPVPPGAECGEEGFCPNDCEIGEPIAQAAVCAPPPPQQSDWPKAYGYPAESAE